MGARYGTSLTTLVKQIKTCRKIVLDKTRQHCDVPCRRNAHLLLPKSRRRPQTGKSRQQAPRLLLRRHHPTLRQTRFRRLQRRQNRHAIRGKEREPLAIKLSTTQIDIHNRVNYNNTALCFKCGITSRDIMTGAQANRTG